MSLDKAIASGKEHRKQYYKNSQRFFGSCRCHGSCDWCRSNRTIQEKREKERTDVDMYKL